VSDINECSIVSVRWTRLLCYWLHLITPVVGALHCNTDNICDNLSPYFYSAVMPQCPSVTFRSLLRAVITSNGILHTWFHCRISDKIVMWRFFRNRRLILRLHRPTIFSALIYWAQYWAHRAVILAIAWFTCVFGYSSFFCSVSGHLTPLDQSPNDLL